MQVPSSLSTRLQYQHESLTDMIDGFTDEQLRRQVVPGKWSIFENIVHLQTYQHIFITRVQQILEKENPSFERYTADTDPQFLEGCNKPTEEIWRDLFAVRELMAKEILEFPSTDYIKTGTHPVYGKLTLGQWLNFFLLHEAHHLLTIFKLGAELRLKG